MNLVQHSPLGHHALNTLPYVLRTRRLEPRLALLRFLLRGLRLPRTNTSASAILLALSLSFFSATKARPYRPPCSSPCADAVWLESESKSEALEVSALELLLELVEPELDLDLEPGLAEGEGNPRQTESGAT